MTQISVIQLIVIRRLADMSAARYNCRCNSRQRREGSNKPTILSYKSNYVVIIYVYAVSGRCEGIIRWIGNTYSLEDKGNFFDRTLYVGRTLSITVLKLFF